MIETSNPEIDVNELMERVRREAAKVRPVETTEHRSPRATRRAVLPTLSDIVPPPPLGLSRPADVKKERIDGLLQKARQMIEVGSWIPKVFRALFRRQGGFNRAVLETLNTLAKQNQQLNKRMRETVVAAEQQHQWMRSLVSQRHNEAAWIKAATPIISSLAPLDGRLSEFENRLLGSEAAAQEAISRLTEEGARREERGAHLERQAEHLRDLQSQVDGQGQQARAWQERTSLTANDVGTLRADLSRAGEHLRNLQGLIDRQALDISNLQKTLIRIEERETNDAVYIKGELAQQGALLRQTFFKDPGGSATSARTSGAPGEGVDAHRLDSFYLSFENRFRGERSEIKRRVSFYLRFLQEAAAGTPGRPILDVGCGRGEWLELIREHDLEGAGVDLNTAMIAQCQQRGFAVAHADAVEHLRTLPSNSLGAVTGFHIIEHLPLAVLVDLVGESQRVLHPGGIAIFESPNCKNLLVGATNFNVDPTHQNPIYPETAQFILETQGFEQVRLEYLSPMDQSQIESEEIAPEVRRLLYGPQDFAVIGRKPGAG